MALVTPSSLTELAARVEELEGALFTAYNFIVSERFQPDVGKPPIIKDGVFDRVIDQCRRALAAQQQDRPTERK